MSSSYIIWGFFCAKMGEEMATEPAILHFTKLSSHQTPSGGLREAIRFDVLCSGESFAHFLMAYTTQCGNLANFLPLRFYVKSVLAAFKRSKTAVLNILEALNFDISEITHLKMLKIPKNSKFRAAKTVTKVFRGLKMTKLISHNFWVAGKFLNFHNVQ